MGVKEYRFLTKTMKTITTHSNKLEKANRRLAETVDDLNDSRASESILRSKILEKEISLQELKRDSRWKEINATKKELAAKKAKISIFLLNPKLKAISFIFFYLSWLLFVIFFAFLSLYVVSISTPQIHIFAFITTVLVAWKRKELAGEKYSPIWVLEAKLNNLESLEGISENLWKGRKKIESKLKGLNKELSELKNDIKETSFHRDSTKKEIKLLEKEIAPLWDSIAHLIPFSTALEKA